MNANLFIRPDGNVECIYSEELPLAELGPAAIRRASHVEPTEDGRWTADMSPCGGPVLGSFPLRSMALAAEQEWLSSWLEGAA